MKQRDIDPGEACPICYEELDAGKEDRVFCRKSCGRNIHARCMKVWADHQATLDKQLTCPLCRGLWGALIMPTKCAFVYSPGPACIAP